MNTDTAHPMPKKLTLKKETLRRLTPAELRLVAGGVVRVTDVACWPKTNAWTGKYC
jgi:hypothetical protein